MSELPNSVVIFFAMVGMMGSFIIVIATIGSFFTWKDKTDSEIRSLCSWKDGTYNNNNELLWKKLRELEQKCNT